MMCRVSTRDDLKLMDVGAGKAAMSKVVPGFPSTVRYGVFAMCTMTSCLCFLYGMQLADFSVGTDLIHKSCIGAADCCSQFHNRCRSRLYMLFAAGIRISCHENVPTLPVTAASPAYPQLRYDAFHI